MHRLLQQSYSEYILYTAVPDYEGARLLVRALYHMNIHQNLTKEDFVSAFDTLKTAWNTLYNESLEYAEQEQFNI